MKTQILLVPQSFRIFIKGADDNLNAFVKLAGLQSLEGRTIGKDIFSDIVDCVTAKLDIDFKNLVGVCTDGAPARCGKRSGATALLQERI